MFEKILFKVPFICALLSLLYWAYDALFETGYTETNHSLYMTIITFFLSWNLTLHSYNNGPKLFWVTWCICLIWIYCPELIGLSFGPIVQIVVMMFPLPSFLVYHLFVKQQEESN